MTDDLPEPTTSYRELLMPVLVRYVVPVGVLFFALSAAASTGWLVHRYWIELSVYAQWDAQTDPTPPGALTLHILMSTGLVVAGTWTYLNEVMADD